MVEEMTVELSIISVSYIFYQHYSSHTSQVNRSKLAYMDSAKHTPLCQ